VKPRSSCGFSLGADPGAGHAHEKESHVVKFTLRFMSITPPREGRQSRARDRDGGGHVGFATSGMLLNVVPNPSAISLFGLGGLMAIRRRR
jgi:hypothetical protein